MRGGNEKRYITISQTTYSYADVLRSLLIIPLGNRQTEPPRATSPGPARKPSKPRMPHPTHGRGLRLAHRHVPGGVNSSGRVPGSFLWRSRGVCPTPSPGAGAPHCAHIGLRAAAVSTPNVPGSRPLTLLLPETRGRIASPLELGTTKLPHLGLPWNVSGAQSGAGLLPKAGFHPQQQPCGAKKLQLQLSEAGSRPPP